MKSYQTWLPVFMGFYGTIFEPDESNEIYSINQERKSQGLPELQYDDFKFDYTSYQNEVAKYACQWVERQLNAIGIKNTIKFEEVSSPKYYNFKNDSVNITIDLDKEAALAYLVKNKGVLWKYFEDRYKSRSGFISFYSHDIETWIELFKNDEKSDHVCGAILDAIILNEVTQADISMYEYVAENVYLTCENYAELTESK